MQGIIRASARLLVMAGVMAAVLVGATVAGIGTTTAIAVAIVAAGVVGVVMATRRQHGPSNHEQIAAMMAPPVTAPAPVLTPTQATQVDVMAPPNAQAADPEANMPRWRRPSLLEARRSDPSRQVASYRVPMRFAEHETNLDIRVVRYAVVPVLDRPDEVLGLQLSGLEHGDEVSVVGSSGQFVEVQCPNGERGWVHRTTLAARVVEEPEPSRSPMGEADEAITSLLSVRGLT
jgi:hypothetical protein